MMTYHDPLEYDEEIIAAAVAELRHDKDTAELPDGRILRLVIESDDMDPFAEYGADCYGRIEWADDPRLRGEYGYSVRPDGMDGNAERLHTGRDAYWWQPPADGPKRGTDEFEMARQLVRDLLEYGMSVAIVEVCQGEDAYGRPIVVGSSALGGIEPASAIDPAILRDVVEDAIANVPDRPPVETDENGEPIHVGHFSRLGGTWWCDTCNSPYCDLA